MSYALPFGAPREEAVTQWSYTSACAFVADHDAHEIVVPSTSPTTSDHSRHATLSQDDHALSSSTLFLPQSSQHGGHVLARVVDQGYCLELSYNAFTLGSCDDNSGLALDLGSSNQQWPPVRFVFGSKLVPQPSLVLVSPSPDDDADSTPTAKDEAELQIYALTESGRLHVLHFSLPKLFYSSTAFDEADDDDDSNNEPNLDRTASGRPHHRWCEEFTVSCLANRTPVLMHGVDVSRVVVACADGFAASLVIADADELIETELRSSSNFFSVRSLLPSFSTRNLASPSQYHNSNANPSGSTSNSNASSQIVSFASSVPEADKPTFAFSVSRDRKLKIWDLDAGVELKTIDLPKPASSSTSALALIPSDASSSTDSPARTTKSTGLLLSSTPQTFVKLVDVPSSSSSSTITSHLVIFSPASSTSRAAFFAYAITLDEETKLLSELTPVGEKLCPHLANANASLVDFAIQPLALGDDARWTLWTVWDEGGECVVRTIDFPELDPTQAMTSVADEGTSSSNEWVTVESGTAGLVSRWTAPYFDELFDTEPNKGVTEVFVEHVSYPGRYPLSTLDHALAQYEDRLEHDIAEGRIAHKPEAMELFYETVLERIVAVVGCAVSLEQSSQTGAMLYDAFNQKLKVEWLKFVTMLNESRRDALFPTSLAVDAESKIAFVVTRQAIVVPTLLDESQLLYDVARSGSSTGRLADYFTFSYERVIEQALSVVRAIQALRSGLDPLLIRNFENELLETLRTDRALDVGPLADDLWETVLHPCIDEELSSRIRLAIAPADQLIISLCGILTTWQTPAAIDPPMWNHGLPASNLASALIADAWTAKLESRYELALGLVMFMILKGRDQCESPNVITSHVFAAFHSLSRMLWVARQGVSPNLDTELALITATASKTGTSKSTADDDDEVFSRFGKMNVSKGLNRSSDAGADAEQAELIPAYSLFHALIRSCFAPRLPISVRPLSHALTLTPPLVHVDGLLGPCDVIRDTPEDATFAMRVHDLGFPTLAIRLLDMVPNGAGMMYVRGLAQLSIGGVAEAEMAFEKAASGLCESIFALIALNRSKGELIDCFFVLILVLLADASSDSTSSMSDLLPTDVSGSLARYYTHIVALFVESNFDGSVIRFAQLALEAFDDTPEGAPEAISSDLWLQLFRSQASLNRYEDAYTTLVSIPHPSTRTICLGHLISVMCENGSASQLIKFAFVGMEADLERNLAFRARNSDPLATPNYYTILYAYYIRRGDYRSENPDIRAAGTIMFQQARRIGETSSRNVTFHDLATLQCQGYLAAINALSLVSPDHAWAAISTSGSAEDRAAPPKRRRLSYDIPDDELSLDSSSPPDILDLSDIRQEYTMALSRLQLAVDFPELERPSFSLEGESIVSLFSQTGAFDAAFQAARVLDVDMSSLFEVVTDRCVGLTMNPESTEDASWVTLCYEASTWEGTLASKAWRLLERHLARHDSSTSRYRLVVLERILAIDAAHSEVPAFLAEHFLKKDVGSLLRSLIRYERLGEAFGYAVRVVRSSTPTCSLASSSLPYSTFDHLLSLDRKDTVALPPAVLESKQAELRTLISERIGQAEKGERVALRNAGR
ncbi:BZ3500_MvSof-1268-A1-R1_Chr1-3g02525 [Microbotryum saponariae]|uniref:BZ3500_MvSof-1268-A1-R1_Chr1-3g02525 protein n=1 Tax=Microbotryum saponariae TaxID=289078 RepID=A0A2X0KCK6_9BASI|nr:BZ3500_MvSof-1268-A1-R1_Chr1-3g02525 [Microbotryum saponariae]SCZ96485.1 BZ3501_MvSof-1269-A2-R1_Chr1-3g02128 [Microbotryum saponariae]